MRYLELELTNVGPHRHRTLTFNRDAKVIAIAGENDKGKSWIIRSLAALSVTGKNEYFDKEAIFDGEDRAEIRGVFLGRNDLPHEIKRVYTKKEAEGVDEIYYDGDKVLPTKFTEILCEEFQVTDPKILLSLAVSMQGETHFFLKAKRRDREEGLRALTPYERIDAWKEHLSKIVSSQDKSLTERKNTLTGRKEALEEQKKATVAKMADLNAEIASLTQGSTPSGKPWVLETQVQAWTAWGKTLEERETAARELLTLQTNITLFKGTLGKLEEEREKSPLKNLSQAEIQHKETQLETEEKLHREALNWKRLEAEEKTLKDLEEKIAEIQKELNGIKLLLSPEEESTLAIARDAWELALKDLDRMVPAPTSTTEIEETKIKIADLLSKETARRGEEEKIRGKSQGVTRSKRLLKTHLEEAGIKIESPNISDWKDQIQTRVTELQKSLTSKKISEGEAILLKQRILANWPEEIAIVPCPICEENLAENRRFKSAEARQLLQQDLEEKLAENEGETELPGGEDLQKLILLENLLRKEIPLIEEEEKECEALLQTLEKDSTAAELETQRKKLETQLKDWQDRETCEKAVNLKATALEPLCKDGTGTTLREKAAWILQESRARRDAKVAKTSLLEEKTQAKTQAQSRVETAKEACQEKSPQIKILVMEDEKTIRESHAAITANLETFRKEKNALAPTLEKITREKTKIQETEQAEVAKKQEVESLQKKTPWETGLVHPEDKDDAPEAGSLWTQKAKRLEEVNTLLREETPKAADIEGKIKSTAEEMTTVCREASQLEAGQELANFLDYKNAPRKLLALVVDDIFHQANKIAKTFNLGMALSQGKNLEFNVIQSRNGREIIQKTERLGFGKANVLGICTRLAAQRILAPSTGFLILDEPSAYVDTLRKNALREFFKMLGETQEGGIPQIILVEHEESIAQAANQVIWID